MAFWRTWSWDTSAIDALLDSEDVTLEKLFEEGDILGEAKAQNKKLVDFLSHDEALSKMISYITEEHPELDESTESKYKYPYIAMEILCADIVDVQEAIFRNPQFLDKILSFWCTVEPLDHFRAGYVNRVTSALLNKRRSEVISRFRAQENFVACCLSHLDDTHVVDLLLKLIASDDAESSAVTWLSEEHLIPNVVTKFDGKESAETQENAAQLLSSLISISMQNNASGVPNSACLLTELESEAQMKVLIDLVFTDASSPAFIYGSQVLAELIRHRSSETFDFEKPMDNLPSVLQLLSQRIPQLDDFLRTSPEDEAPTSWGKLSPPFGQSRMKALEMMGMLVTSRYLCIYHAIMDSAILSTALDLFFQYRWNNFLHAIVGRVITLLLECNDSDICNKLLAKTNVHERIAQAGLEDENAFDNDGYTRAGYMGFLVLLTGALRQAAPLNRELEEALSQSDVWCSYVEGNYSACLELESRPLGGGVVMETSEEEDGDTVIQYQHALKRDFENDFPKNFSFGDFENPDIDALYHPSDGMSFAGIPCLEVGFGEEFDSDDEDEEHQ